MKKRPKVELVPVEADSDTQRVLERFIFVFLLLASHLRLDLVEPDQV